MYITALPGAGRQGSIQVPVPLQVVTSDQCHPHACKSTLQLFLVKRNFQQAETVHETKHMKQHTMSSVLM